MLNQNLPVLPLAVAVLKPLYTEKIKSFRCGVVWWCGVVFLPIIIPPQGCIGLPQVVAIFYWYHWSTKDNQCKSYLVKNNHNCLLLAIFVILVSAVISRFQKDLSACFLIWRTRNSETSRIRKWDRTDQQGVASNQKVDQKFWPGVILMSIYILNTQKKSQTL